MTFDMQAAAISEHEDRIIIDKDEEKYLPVSAIYGPNGGGKSTLAKVIMGIKKPTSGKILFNGEEFEIDRVTDIRQAAAMKAGGQGDRYTIWVRGKQSYLFFERNHSLTGNNLGRWFVERRTA